MKENLGKKWSRTLKKLETGIKKCPKCNTDKPFSDFDIAKERSDGHRGCCRKCSLIMKHETNQRNPEWRIAYNKKYSKEHYKEIVGKRTPERNAYNHAKYIMKKRGLALEIPFEKFSNIMHQHCSYCGSNHKIGSVDRIDSAKGYFEGNVQPLCHRCNEMKSDINHLDFVLHINKINQYLNNKGE